MAQVRIPTEFPKQITLLNNIVTKNNEPGFDSPLTGWLTENKIDLAADAEAGVAAQDKEVLRARQDALGKAAFKSRDTLFKPVFTFVRAAAQVLKKYYVTNTATLADWGLPVTDSGRIAYPPSFEERNAIATKFFTKLAEFADGKSPLAAYIATNKTDVGGLEKNNTDAAKQNTTADQAEKDAENATEQRDLLWTDPLAHIHLIADYLKSVYASNPRALGDWGFVVDESVTVRKERKVRLIIGETRMIENIAIGSILINLGKGDAIVYKGKKAEGAYTLLKVNEKMGVVKGYSKITVVNPSSLDTLTLSILSPEE